MSKQDKIKQLTDLMAGRISKSDLAANRIYFHEKVSKDGEIISEKLTFQGKEVTSVPEGATVWEEVKTYE